MNRIPTELMNVGLSPPDLSGFPADETSTQPSFNEHLQQAQQQGDSTSRLEQQPSRDERPVEESRPAADASDREDQPPDEDHPVQASDDARPTDGKAASESHGEDDLHDDPATDASDVPAAAAVSLHVLAAIETLLPSNEKQPSEPAAEGTASLLADTVQSASGSDQKDDAHRQLGRDLLLEGEAPPAAFSASPKEPDAPEVDLLTTRIDTLQVEPSPPAAAGSESQAQPESPRDASSSEEKPRDARSANRVQTTPIELPAALDVLPVISASAVAIGSPPVDTTTLPNTDISTSPTLAAHESAVETPTQGETTTTSSLASGEATASAKPPSFTLPGRSSLPASGTPQLSDADRARFVQRVASAFQAAGDGGHLRLRLSPPELGSLRLDVSIHQGVLTAQVEAETPQARLLLLENLPALRERLQEQNIKIERFTVELMNQSPGGQPQGFRQRNQEASDEPMHKLRSQGPAADAVTERRPATARRLSGGEQLNVVI